MGSGAIERGAQLFLKLLPTPKEPVTWECRAFSSSTPSSGSSGHRRHLLQEEQRSAALSCTRCLSHLPHCHRMSGLGSQRAPHIIRCLILPILKVEAQSCLMDCYDTSGTREEGPEDWGTWPLGRPACFQLLVP